MKEGIRVNAVITAARVFAFLLYLIAVFVVAGAF